MIEDDLCNVLSSLDELDEPPTKVKVSFDHVSSAPYARLPGETVREGVLRRQREKMHRDFKNKLGRDEHTPVAKMIAVSNPEPESLMSKFAGMFRRKERSEGKIKMEGTKIDPGVFSSIPEVEVTIQGKLKDEAWIFNTIAGMRDDPESKADPELFKLLTATIEQFRRQTREDVLPMSKTELTPEEQAAADVAAYLTKQWEGMTETVMLASPASLTVLKDDGTYSRRSHIGGEEFRPTRAYIGKKGHMICCFEPVSPETYVEMQMPNSECMDKLSGYRQNIQENGTMAKLGELRKSKEEIQHKRDLQENSQKYGDFGAW